MHLVMVGAYVVKQECASSAPLAVFSGSNESQDFRGHNGVPVSHSVSVSKTAIAVSFTNCPLDIFFSNLN
jgi:hypothetical protein